MPAADRLRVVGVVPASGASRRMGRPKATIDVQGRSFLERVSEALREGGCSRVVVVVAEQEGSVRAEAERLDVEVVLNPDPGDGPITSLRRALDRLDPDVDAVAWLPLDHPLVEGAHVARLLEASRRSGASLTIPVHAGKRGHPAIFRRSLFAELSDPELEGGARTVVHRHLGRACLVDFDEPGVVIDVDTPEALERLRASLAGGGSG